MSCFDRVRATVRSADFKDYLAGDNSKWALFLHTREWHSPGDRIRLATLPWVNRAAFLREVRTRFLRRLAHLPLGITETSIRLEEACGGSIEAVAEHLVEARERRISPDLHPSTLNGYRVWQDRLQDTNRWCFYFPGRFVVTEDRKRIRVLNKLLGEVAELDQTIARASFR